ncbi:MAG: tetratricopeptide repeat protein [Planctomycetaceae bacterium]
MISCLGVGLTIGAVAILHGFQLERLAVVFRDLGVQARASGDSLSAIQHLRRYLAIAPDDVSTIRDLAFSVEESAERGGKAHYQAIRLFERILRESPADAAVRTKVVDGYMAIGRFGDAIEHLGLLLNDDPQNPEWLLLRAGALERHGQYAEAKTAYRDAIDASPNDLNLYARLASLLNDRLEEPDEAENLLNALVQRNAQNADAHLERSRFHWRRGSLAESRIDAVRAYRLEPGNPDVLIFLAALAAHSQSESLPITVEDLKSKLLLITQDAERQQSATLALAELAVLEGKYDEAEILLDSALSALPEWDLGHLLRAEILILKGDVDAAGQEIGQFEDHLGGRAYLSEFLRARADFAVQKWPEAALLFRQVFANSSAPQTVRTHAGLGIATCYQETGQLLRAQRMCLEVLQVNPSSSEAAVRLAQSYVRLDRLEEAIRHYKSFPDSPGTAAMIAELQIEKNRRRAPSDQNWSRVESVVESAAQKQQNPVDAALLRSSFLLAQRKSDDATTLLDRLLENHAGDERLWLMRLKADVSSGNWTAASNTLVRADAALGRPEFSIGPGIRLAMAQRDLERLSRLEESIATLGVEKQVPLLRLLADAWQRLGSEQDARRCWNVVREHRPHDLSVREALFALAMQENDSDQARELILEMQKLEGTAGVHWRMAEARQLLSRIERGERHHLEDARVMLEQLVVELQQSAQLATLMGDLHRLEGDTDAAIKQYAEAIELGTPSQHVLLQMAGLLYEQDRFAEVRELIRRFEQEVSRSLDPRLAQLGVFSSLRDNQAAEALHFVELAVSPDAVDFRSQIWLGQIQHLAGQDSEAERAFQSAIELAPSEPVVWLEWVTFLTQTDRHDAAHKAVLQAQTAVPAKLADFTLAQCYEVLDKPQLAATHYDRAVSNLIDDPQPLTAAARFYTKIDRRARAGEILQSVVSGEIQAAEPVLVVARRLLAEFLAESRQYPARTEAISLLEGNLAAPNTATRRVDLQHKARTLAVSPVRDEQRQAVALYETLQRDGLLPIRDAQQLAQLYRDLGESEQARALTKNIVARAPRSPVVLTWAVNLMLDRTMDTPDVDSWLELLTELRPDALETLMLQANFLVLRDRDEEALSFLESICPKQLTDGNRQRLLLLTITADQLSQDLGRLGKTVPEEDFALFAEGHYRRLSDDPNVGLLLVQFHIRRWQMDKAIEHCGALRGKIDDDRLARIYVSLLRSRRLLSPEQVAQIQAWLNVPNENQNESVTQVLCRAHAALLNGDYESAMTDYRHIIDVDPQNVEALNELALLEALRGPPSSHAMSYIELAIEQSGPVGILLDTRASVELANQEPQKAAQTAQAAIDEAPVALHYFHLAQAQLALGQQKSARDTLRTAVKLGLHEGTVHPLERATLENLQAELNR